MPIPVQTLVFDNQNSSWRLGANTPNLGTLRCAIDYSIDNVLMEDPLDSFF